jgi:hypothetical protein
MVKGRCNVGKGSVDCCAPTTWMPHEH